MNPGTIHARRKRVNFFIAFFIYHPQKRGFHLKAGRKEEDPAEIFYKNKD